MKQRISAFLLIAVVISVGGCGFKSDLFLPDQPENPGQLDSESIETLTQRAPDSMQDESQIRGATEGLDDIEGVPVIIVPADDDDDDEIKKNRDNNELP